VNHGSATTGQVHHGARLRWLATIDFVALQNGTDGVAELTTDGRLYLEGKVDSRLRIPSKAALR